MHAGFNAELTDNGQAADSVASYSLGWDSFATKTCLPSHHPSNGKVVDNVGKTEEFPVDDADDDDDNENDIDDASMYTLLSPHSIHWIHINFNSLSARSNKVPVDNEDSAESDGDYSDEDDDDDFDDEIVINNGKVVHGSSDRDSRVDVFEIEDEENSKVLAMAFVALPYILIVMAALIILGMIAFVISQFMHRRGERYRQALLASKNSIIYQKLSEEIHAPQTPKFHRYAPIPHQLSQQV